MSCPGIPNFTILPSGVGKYVLLAVSGSAFSTSTIVTTNQGTVSATVTPQAIILTVSGTTTVNLTLNGCTQQVNLAIFGATTITTASRNWCKPLPPVKQCLGPKFNLNFSPIPLALGAQIGTFSTTSPSFPANVILTTNQSEVTITNTSTIAPSVIIGTVTVAAGATSPVIFTATDPVTGCSASVSVEIA